MARNLLKSVSCLSDNNEVVVSIFRIKVRLFEESKVEFTSAKRMSNKYDMICLSFLDKVVIHIMPKSLKRIKRDFLVLGIFGVFLHMLKWLNIFFNF